MDGPYDGIDYACRHAVPRHAGHRWLSDKQAVI
jgi:hypothetical protein